MSDKDSPDVQPKGDPEVDTEQGELEDSEEGQSASQPNGEDTIPNVTHEFGVILLANLNGQGVQFQIVPPEQGMNHAATPDDMMMIIGLAHVHMQGNMYASKFLQAMQQQSKNIQVSKKMPFTGPRR